MNYKISYMVKYNDKWDKKQCIQYGIPVLQWNINENKSRRYQVNVNPHATRSTYDTAHYLALTRCRHRCWLTNASLGTVLKIQQCFSRSDMKTQILRTELKGVGTTIRIQEGIKELYKIFYSVWKATKQKQTNYDMTRRWVGKLVARLLVLATAALWVRIQTSLKNTKGGDISKGANTL